MTSPPTSAEVPKKDKPDPTLDHPIEPIHITTTPLHSSTSDLGSSTVMVSSHLFEQDSKTATDLSEAESPGHTVVLSFARGDVPDGDETRRVVEDVVPAIPISSDAALKDAKERETKDDVERGTKHGERGTNDNQDVHGNGSRFPIKDSKDDDDQGTKDDNGRETKDNQNAHGMDIGISPLNDSTRDEDEVKLETAKELLNLHMQKEQVHAEIKAVPDPQERLKPKDHKDERIPVEDARNTIIPPGSYVFGTMPGGLVGITDDGRPYPPVPVLPSYPTTSSATATSGFGSLPSYSSLPFAGDGSSQGVHMIPPQADLPEIDRQEDSDLPDFLREFADRPETVGRMFYDQKHATAQQIRAAHRAFPRVQIKTLDGQTISPSGSASSDFYRPYADGTQAFDPVENQAHLQAQHQQRVANIATEKETRAKALRAMMEAASAIPPVGEKDGEGGGKGDGGAGKVPGMVKGLSKVPPKRKSTGARVMALRASKPARKDAPGMLRCLSREAVANSLVVPVIPRRSRVFSTNSAPTGQGQSSLTSSTESVLNNSTERKPIAEFTLFTQPPRGRPPIKTYQRQGAAPGLQPAFTIHNAPPINLGTTHGDAESDGTRETDSDDTESGDAEIFDGPNLRRNFDLAGALQQQFDQLLSLSLQVLVDVWPSYERSVTGEFSVSSGEDDSAEPIDVSRSTGSERQSLGDNVKVQDIIRLVEEIWGFDKGYVQFATLFQREDFLSTATLVSGDEEYGHRYIQMIVNDIVDMLEETNQTPSEDQGVTDLSDAQGTSDADRERASDEAFDDASSAYMASRELPSPSLPNVPLYRGQIGNDVTPSPIDHEATKNDIRVEVNIDKDAKVGPVKHEPWMDNDTPAPVKAKAKKNKNKKKKKSAVPATNSQVPGSATYYDKGKTDADDGKPRGKNNATEPPDVIVSQELSENSEPEPTVKSAYVTANIFDQLKISDDTDGSPGPQIKLSVENKQSSVPAQSIDGSKQGAKEDTASALSAGTPHQTIKAENKKGQLTFEPVPSWADSAVDSFPSLATPGDSVKSITDPSVVPKTPAALANAQVPAKSVAGQSSGRGFFPNQWVGPVHHGNGLPAANLAKNQTAEARSRGDNASPARLGPQLDGPRTRFNTGGLSLRDIREGATVERHPTRGTECVILREPLERPNYDSILFVSG